MSDEKLIDALRRMSPRLDMLDCESVLTAADRIEAQAAEIERLTQDRERLALAICGGEDAPGYANAQTVETLEKVARDNHNATMEQVNYTLAAEAKLAKAMGGLKECEAEIDAYIQYEYPHDHPVQERCRQRDYAANPARVTLAELKGQDDE